jgi:hypothetical protein
MARHLLRRRGDGNGGLLKKCLTQPRLFAGALTRSEAASLNLSSGKVKRLDLAT